MPRLGALEGASYSSLPNSPCPSLIPPGAAQTLIFGK